MNYTLKRRRNKERAMEDYKRKWGMLDYEVTLLHANLCFYHAKVDAPSWAKKVGNTNTLIRYKHYSVSVFGPEGHMKFNCLNDAKEYFLMRKLAGI